MGRIHEAAADELTSKPGNVGSPTIGSKKVTQNIGGASPIRIQLETSKDPTATEPGQAQMSVDGTQDPQPLLVSEEPTHNDPSAADLTK